MPVDMASECAAKRKRYASSVIKLIVGEEKEELTVHEARLRDHSAFFRAALDKRWKEGLTGTIELPEDDADEVATYIEWLYNPGKLDLSPASVFSAGLYTFGERVLDDSFCDEVLTGLLSRIDTPDEKGSHLFGSGPFMHKLYAGTSSGSPARACFVSIYANYAVQDWFTTCEKFPAEFMFDLLKAMTASKEIPTFQSWHERREQWFKTKKEE